MKKHLFTVICLLILTNMWAQKPDVKSLQECQNLLKEYERNLNNEKRTHKATKDSIQKLNDALEKTQEDLEKEKRANNLLRKDETRSVTGKNCQELKDSLNIAISDKEKAEREKKALQNTINDLEKAKKMQPELPVPISKIQRVFPFFVTDINVRSTCIKKNKYQGQCTDYGKSLSKTEWITLQIYCTGLIDEAKDITMRIKIYMPNGLLWQYYEKNLDGSYAFFGSSTKYFPVTIYPGNANLIAVNVWGVNKKNLFPEGELKKKGKYRIEIWHEDVCLGSTTFEIK